MKIILLLLFISCHGNTDKLGQKSNKATNSGQAINLSETNGDEKIENAIGILTTNNKYKFGDTIHVYQSNGKLLTILKRTDEYQIIALKCLAKTAVSYEVQLENGKKGMISKYSKHIKFQTWEEHILSLFSVGFSENHNPLMDKPSLKSKKLNFDKDEFYHPKRIEGEWLQVEWDNSSKKEYGWIRWKNKGRLLVELYYFA